MKSNKGIVFIIILILGGIVFWKREEIKKRLGFTSIPGILDNGSSNAKDSSVKDSDTALPARQGLDYVECRSYPIRLGCKGNNVSNLQKGLNKAYKAALTEDGYFGQKTKDALIANGYAETVEVADMLKIIKAMV